jgi:hypothetical protein
MPSENRRARTTSSLQARCNAARLTPREPAHVSPCPSTLSHVGKSPSGANQPLRWIALDDHGNAAVIRERPLAIDVLQILS